MSPSISQTEREFSDWVREHGPQHLRGASQRFDVVDAALRYYADALAAKIGGVVIHKKGLFPREREAPTPYMLERRDYIVNFVQSYSRTLPKGLLCLVSPLCRINHVRRFTGVIIEISIGVIGGYHLLVDLEG